MSICIYVCLDYIVCHNNRIEATIFILHVGVVKIGNFASFLDM